MRFIATADWQLGMSAHYLDDEARPRFHQARFDVVRRIGELATEHDARFVVVAGDVFESNKLDRSVVSRALEVLNGYPVPVVLLPGNHDPLDAASIYDDPAFRDRAGENIHVIREPGVYDLMPGVEIVGAPWFSKRPLGDLVAEACEDLDPVEEGTTRVVLGHGAVDTLNPDRDDPATIEVSRLRQVVDEGLVHVVILGDRHGMYEVDERIWYPGAPEVTDRREIDPGHVLLIEVREGSVTVAPQKVGTWVFETIDHYFTVDSDVDVFEKKLTDMPAKERTALWLTLTGTLTTRARARLDRIIDEFGDVFARIAYWDRHTELVTVADDADFHDLGLAGFAADALNELKGIAEGDGEKATTAQDSLGLLYRLSSGGAR